MTNKFKKCALNNLVRLLIFLQYYIGLSIHLFSFSDSLNKIYANYLLIGALIKKISSLFEIEIQNNIIF